MAELDRVARKAAKEGLQQQHGKLRMWLRSERADMLLPLFFVLMGALILTAMELGK